MLFKVIPAPQPKETVIPASAPGSPAVDVLKIADQVRNDRLFESALMDSVSPLRLLQPCSLGPIKAAAAERYPVI
ncbi:MAG: hypothetical protein ACI9LO_000296 [Planctomycetota bacterium]